MGRPVRSSWVDHLIEGTRPVTFGVDHLRSRRSAPHASHASRSASVSRSASNVRRSQIQALLRRLPGEFLVPANALRVSCAARAALVNPHAIRVSFTRSVSGACSFILERTARKGLSTHARCFGVQDAKLSEERTPPVELHNTPSIVVRATLLGTNWVSES
jgi:hypothetical protein